MEDGMSRNMHDKHTQQAVIVAVCGMARVGHWVLKLEAYVEMVM